MSSKKEEGARESLRDSLLFANPAYTIYLYIYFMGPVLTVRLRWTVLLWSCESGDVRLQNVCHTCQTYHIFLLSIRLFFHPLSLLLPVQTAGSLAQLCARVRRRRFRARQRLLATGSVTDVSCDPEGLESKSLVINGVYIFSHLTERLDFRSLLGTARHKYWFRSEGKLCESVDRPGA
jgi:hypothetical protein